MVIFNSYVKLPEGNQLNIAWQFMNFRLSLPQNPKPTSPSPSKAKWLISNANHLRQCAGVELLSYTRLRFDENNCTQVWYIRCKPVTFGFPMFETPMTHANHIEIIEDNMANFGGPAHPSSIHLNKVAVICGKISTVPKGNNFLNHSSNHLPIYPSFPHHFPIN